MKYKITTTESGFFTPFVRRRWRWVHLRSSGDRLNPEVIEERGSQRCSYKVIDDAIELVKLHALCSPKYFETRKLKLTIFP